MNGDFLICHDLGFGSDALVQVLQRASGMLVSRLRVYRDIALRNAICRVTTSQVGAKLCCGLYSIDSGNKIVGWDGFDGTNNTGSKVVQIPSVMIPSGVYLFASGSDVSGSAVSVAGKSFTNSLAALIGAQLLFQTLPNVVGIGGICPSNIGTLIPATTATQIPNFILE